MRNAGKARTLVARFHSSPVRGLGYCPAEPTALFTTAPPVAASGRSTTETLDQYPRTEFLGSPSRESGGSWDHADVIGGSSGATGVRRAVPNPRSIPFCLDLLKEAKAPVGWLAFRCHPRR